MGTYCVWRGGLEAARGRAILLWVLHFGLLMWGLLMLQQMSSVCYAVFNKKFPMLWIFYEMCLWSNAVFFLLLTLHETVVAKYVGADLTLMAKVSLRPAPAPLNRAANMKVQQPSHAPPYDLLKPPNDMYKPPQGSIGLPPQLNYEYEKIMGAGAAGLSGPVDGLSWKGTSSTLPQSTP